MEENEFRHIMQTLANYMRSLNVYNKIFCDSGKSKKQTITLYFNSSFQQHIVTL